MLHGAYMEYGGEQQSPRTQPQRRDSLQYRRREVDQSALGAFGRLEPHTLSTSGSLREYGPMSSMGADMTLFWCLEQMCSSRRIPYDSFLDFLSQIDIDDLSTVPCPVVLKVRLILVGLQNQGALTMETLRSLIGLENLLIGARGEFEESIWEFLMPSPDMLLQVKTYLVSEMWKENPSVSVRDVGRKIHAVFGQNPSPHEQSRMEELIHAGSKAKFREPIDQILEANSTVDMVQSYAREAVSLLGPTFLSVVQNDMLNGTYVASARPFRDHLPRRYDQMPSFAQVAHRSDSRPSMTPFTELSTGVRYGVQEIGYQYEPSKLVDEDEMIEQKAKEILDETRRINELHGYPEGDEDNEKDRYNKISEVLREVDLDEDMVSKVTELLCNAKYLEEGAMKGKKIRSRMNRKWTEEEVEALLQGCREIGIGSWSEILSKYKDKFNARSQVDLKDKWRNLARRKSRDEIEEMIGRKLRDTEERSAQPPPRKRTKKATI